MISIHFVQNPDRISTEDELSDVLVANRGQPINYFAMLNPIDSKKNPAKDMTLEQKMFRKFFYENSSFIESETVFFEITNPKLAKDALGIDNER